MGLIKPQVDWTSENRPYIPSGWHVVQCVSVDDLPPSNRYAKAKPRIRFAFQKFHPAGPVVGPETALYICSAVVFGGNAKVPESSLVTLAKLVGYRNWQAGIDPQRWKDRYFAAKVIDDGKDSWIRLLSPCGEPEGRDQLDLEAWESLSIQASPHFGKDADEPMDLPSDMPF